MPRLVIVAGPNGSGKTTLVRSGVLANLYDVSTVSINADDVAREWAQGGQPTDAQSLAVAQFCDSRLDEHIAAGRSVIVETVLSSDKFQSRVAAAKAARFDVVFLYVTVQFGELNVARVAQRYAQGGHDVPGDRILARRIRSHEYFEWFASQADIVRVFDNTGARPVLAASKHDGAWRLPAISALPEDLANRILRLSGTISRTGP